MSETIAIIAAFGLDYLPRIASVFFFIFFLLVVVRIALMPPSESVRASRLPLDEDNRET